MEEGRGPLSTRRSGGKELMKFSIYLEMEQRRSLGEKYAADTGLELEIMDCVCTERNGAVRI